MSMHLLGPWATTTRYSLKNKKNPKVTKAQHEHEQWLLTRGLHSSQLKKQKPKKLIIDRKDDPTHHIPSMDSMTGSTIKNPEKVYTGTEIIGIAQMHKSNAVPVSGRKQIIEITRMRR
jgi:hypothetical protein